MTLIPTQTLCRRCEQLFCYFRQRRPRIYCSPCVELERIDADAFYNILKRERRQARLTLAEPA